MASVRQAKTAHAANLINLLISLLLGSADAAKTAALCSDFGKRRVPLGWAECDIL
jgi:hypothetical protein